MNRNFFQTAIDYAVPVLSSSWIFTAWKKAKALSEEKYTDEQFVNEHKLQIFSKCVSLFFWTTLYEIAVY